MTDAQKKEMLSFAKKLFHAAELVEAATIEKHGQKAIAKRMRAELNEIKKQITPIKKITLEGIQ